VRQIWKYTALHNEFTVKMPVGARILKALDTQLFNDYHSGRHGENIVFWAVVDPAAPKVHRRFVGVFTGQNCPDELDALEHVGTIEIRRDRLVFHLFDAGEVPAEAVSDGEVT